MNVGQAAGAGVAGHLHLHAMPRWVGDTNFMTTVGKLACCPKTWKRPGAGCARRSRKCKEWCPEC